MTLQPTEQPRQGMSIFLMIITILVGVKWYLLVVLIYNSLIPNKVQHFLIGHVSIFGEMSISLPIFTWVILIIEL